MVRYRDGVKCLCALLLLAAFCATAWAVEYFVNTQGNDTDNGKSREAAFLTVQKGVDALKPGDRLTIGPGEYVENVRVHKLGDPEQDTIIRAEEPGTVLLRGERDADICFQPVPGRRFIHVAPHDGPVLAVLEADSLSILRLAPTVSEVDFGPGRYFHDPAAKKLYISSTDFHPPGRHHYRISVRKGHGLEINESRRVIVDGLAASGFMEPVEKRVLSYPVSGFMIRHSERCIVRRSVAFFNTSGITINNGWRGNMSPGGNRVESCRLYGNVEGVVGHNPGDEVFRDSHSFLNSTYGARFYGERRKGKTCRFQRLVAWGNPGGDYWFKGKGLSGETTDARAEQCVAFKDSHILAYSQGIKGARDYRGDTGPSTIRLPEGNREFHAVIDREFADPLNFDFRPQATATIAKPGKDYPYQGPYPYRANIRYLSPAGSDGNDGFSMTQAWKTLDHAIKNLRPGDTLYLAAGRYRLSTALTALNNVDLRGRGLETPVVDGPLTTTGCRDVSIQRIHWTGPVRIVDSANVTLDNCVFSRGAADTARGRHVVEAEGVEGLRVTHALMAVPLQLRNCAGVDLRGNLYATPPGVRLDRLAGIQYSGYNSYPQADAVWEVAGGRVSLDELRKSRHDVHSRIVTPRLEQANGAASLANAYDFVGRGPLGTALGPWRPWQPQSVRLIGPFAHSTTDSTANVEWWTTQPLKTRIHWGDTPECKNNAVIDQASFFSHSMTGLQPGKTYYVKVEPLSLNPSADPARRFQPLTREAPVLQINTALQLPTSPGPRTLYVSATGDDNRDGASPQTSWRTLQHAADNVRPGDRVLISSGEYPGAVYFRATGALDKPIIFRAAPGEQVKISGLKERLKVGFVLFNKSHYRFDALYFEGFAGIPDNKAGGAAAALAAYLALIDDTPMDDQLRSDLLDRAAQCADRLGDLQQARALAKRIPTPILSCRRQMGLLHRRGKFAELIEEFADRPGRGKFHRTWRCPDDERPLADVLYYRAIAYAKTGDLKQAETDMRAMVDKGPRFGYSPGPSLLDLSWQRLGDFYRDYMKDNAKALESYAHVLDRTTVYHAERPMPKPVLSANSGVLAAATQSACAILRRQGKEDEARKWEMALKKARAEAMVFLKKDKERR